MEQIAHMEDAMNEELIHEVGSNTNPPTEVEVDGGSTTIDADLERMDANNDDDNGEKDDDMPTFQRKKKKKTSKAREDFEEVVLPNKTNKYKCVHCKKLLCMPDTGTTSHLWNHLKRCDAKKLATKKQMNLQFQPSKSKFEMNPLSNGKYDHLKQREATAQWILISEQPFNVVESDGFSFMFQVNLPQFEKISRAQVRSDVITVYEIEKRKLLSMLKCVNKISLTTDIWKSKVQKISYMCVTGHFVDSQYQLQKRVLSFMPLPPPHTGVDIFDGLMKCTKDWGIEHKIFTISVDNASNNDVALRIAKGTFSSNHKLPLEGKLFHVRCAAHILNLVVQDGLSEIRSIIGDVKDSVRFINQSEARLLKFSEIVHHLAIKAKRLIIDCPTRWNSTYEMLVEALKVKDAFPIFAQRETLYHCCPSSGDWEKVKEVVSILEVFYEATHVLSGTHYPTSNVFLAVIWRVKHVLDENEASPNEFVKNMVKKMKEKFDKYWGSCNLLMAIGAILDPRFKMRLVEFAFNKLYTVSESRINLKTVRDALYDLFSEYVEHDHLKARKHNSSSPIENPCPSHLSSMSKGKLIPSGLTMFDDYLNSVQHDAPLKSELDIYLEEGVFRCQEGDVTSEFDALAWWKSQELKFKILSKLARDVLAIPISTVASEATFSAGTRVLDPYRANLSCDMVEVLICGGDWVRQLHGIRKAMKTYEEELPIEVLLIN